MTDTILKAGEIFAGRYEIIRFLGRGGMGAVYEARDRELANSAVALKLIHSDLASDEHLFSRFRNEVLLARSLAHPNIVKTFDLGRTADGAAFISMEYIDGASLKDEITGGLPSVDRALTILREILDAAAHAHDQGIVHRDLKPANVLLSRKGNVKLVDFGTARLLGGGADLTRTGEVIGTPAYMAPEQISGGPIDARTDIYAIAIMAFEILTGKRPFEADNLVGIAMKHLHEPLPSLRSLTPGTPQWLEDAVVRAADKNPEKRFSSAKDFLHALRPPTAERETTAQPIAGAHHETWLWGGLAATAILGCAVLLLPYFRQVPDKPLPEQRLAAVKEPVKQTTVQPPDVRASLTPSTVTTVSTLPPTTAAPTTTLPKPVEPPQQQIPPATIAPEKRVEPVTPSPAAQIFMRLPDSSIPRSSFSRAEVRDMRIIAELRKSTGIESHRYSFRLRGDTGATSLPATLLAAGTAEDPRWRFKATLSQRDSSALGTGRHFVEFLEDGKALVTESFVIE